MGLPIWAGRTVFGEKRPPSEGSSSFKWLSRFARLSLKWFVLRQPVSYMQIFKNRSRGGSRLSGSFTIQQIIKQAHAATNFLPLSPVACVLQYNLKWLHINYFILPMYSHLMTFQGGDLFLLGWNKSNSYNRLSSLSFCLSAILQYKKKSPALFACEYRRGLDAFVYTGRYSLCLYHCSIKPPTCALYKENTQWQIAGKTTTNCHALRNCFIEEISMY